MSSLAFRPHRQREKITLSVTPLIDVLFLLIIFFMLTGTFKRLAELELLLPDSRTAETGTEEREQAPLELVATADGRPFLGDLFGHSGTEKSETEVFILLTPHILIHPSELLALLG